MIASIMYVQQGSMLWKDGRKNLKKRRVGFSDEIDFGKYMKWWRFKQIKYFVPTVMEDSTMRDDGVDWWRFKDHIIKHNENKKQKIRASHVHVFDESLSSFIPRLVFCLFGSIYFIFKPLIFYLLFSVEQRRQVDCQTYLMLLASPNHWELNSRMSWKA